MIEEIKKLYTRKEMDEMASEMAIDPGEYSNKTDLAKVMIDKGFTITKTEDGDIGDFRLVQELGTIFKVYENGRKEYYKDLNANGKY